MVQEKCDMVLMLSISLSSSLTLKENKLERLFPVNRSLSELIGQEVLHTKGKFLALTSNIRFKTL
jgi:hypothetical protein